jgi:hypothetical protein
MHGCACLLDPPSALATPPSPPDAAPPRIGGPRQCPKRAQAHIRSQQACAVVAAAAAPAHHAASAAAAAAAAGKQQRPCHRPPFHVSLPTARTDSARAQYRLGWHHLDCVREHDSRRRRGLHRGGWPRDYRWAPCCGAHATTTVAAAAFPSTSPVLHTEAWLSGCVRRSM